MMFLAVGAARYAQRMDRDITAGRSLSRISTDQVIFRNNEAETLKWAFCQRCNLSQNRGPLADIYQG